MGECQKLSFADGEKDHAARRPLKPSRFLVSSETSQAGTWAVFSTLTGAVSAMTSEELEKLFEGSSLGVEADEALFDDGMLVPKDLDEIALLRRAYQNVKRGEEAYQLMICPTLECNFRCPYCYETRVPGFMAPDVQDAVVDFVNRKTSDKTNRLSVTWYGGEPTLCLKIVISISERIASICSANKCDVNFGMITNGYSLDDEAIKQLAKVHMSTVQITLDGGRETHNKRRHLVNGGGTFDKIVENVIRLSKAGVFVKVRVNVDKTNLESFEKVCSVFANQKNVRIYPSIVTSSSNSAHCASCFGHGEHNLFYSHFENEVFFPDGLDDLDYGIGPCRAEREASAIIGPDGLVYKCLNDVGRPNMHIGTILDDDEVNPQVAALYLGRDPFTEPECSACEYLPQCYGGCIWEYHDKGTHACPPEKYYIKSLVNDVVNESQGGDSI
ncbi:MAG: radical SAM protein [Eggerthellaceae bacterium]|nr:radical SAM protein [Eggerthellaceae bacterium]